MSSTGQPSLAGELEHAGKALECRLAAADRVLGIAHEMTENAARRIAQEDAVPEDMQQRRDAYAPEEQLLLRDVFDVENLPHGVVRKAQEFECIGGMRFTHLIGHDTLDAVAAQHDLRDHCGIEFYPECLWLQEGQTAEPVPAAGLAPDGEPDQVLRFAQFPARTAPLPSQRKRDTRLRPRTRAAPGTRRSSGSSRRKKCRLSGR